jgi:hypothetical protein
VVTFLINISWIPIGLVASISAIVVLAHIKKLPGIGIILVVIILGVVIGFDIRKLSDIGFSAPMGWQVTILWRLGLGIVIAFVSTLIVEPATGKMTGLPHDLSILEIMRGKSGKLASFGILISEIVYGFTHWYQGKRASVSTAINGLLPGDIFIWNGHNLWMPIPTHGVLDTIALIPIFFNQDTGLKEFFGLKKHEY